MSKTNRLNPQQQYRLSTIVAANATEENKKRFSTWGEVVSFFQSKIDVPITERNLRTAMMACDLKGFPFVKREGTLMSHVFTKLKELEERLAALEEEK